MKAFFSKVKKFFTKLSFYFPTRLPLGMTEFDTWATSIIQTYDFPDNDSIKFALATMILHLDSTSAFKPKRYFALTTSKSMSNQIAAGIMHELKDKQQAAAKAEQEAAAKSNGIEGK